MRPRHEVLGTADLLEAGAGRGHDGLHGVHQGVRGQVVDPQGQMMISLMLLPRSVQCEVFIVHRAANIVSGLMKNTTF